MTLRWADKADCGTRARKLLRWPRVTLSSVFLFDIDGTLLSTGGAGRRAMARAFGAVCGNEKALVGVKLGGMTDRLILRAGFEAIGETFSELRYQEVMQSYLRALPEEVSASTNYIVYDGVQAAIARCQGQEHAVVGLGTGNVEKGARIKLERAGLNGHFAFGGFGSDAEQRDAVVDAGIVRGIERLGVGRNQVRVTIIGDTPKDVTAAHACGARCIAIATGGFSQQELHAAGADAVFATLTSEGALEAIVG